MSTLVEIESAAAALSAGEKAELLLFVARLRAAGDEARGFSFARAVTGTTAVIQANLSFGRRETCNWTKAIFNLLLRIFILLARLKFRLSISTSE